VQEPPPPIAGAPASQEPSQQLTAPQVSLRATDPSCFAVARDISGAWRDCRHSYRRERTNRQRVAELAQFAGSSAGAPSADRWRTREPGARRVSRESPYDRSVPCRTLKRVACSKRDPSTSSFVDLHTDRTSETLGKVSPPIHGINLWGSVYVGLSDIEEGCSRRCPVPQICGVHCTRNPT
jgi:hypothetical protein